MGGVLGGAIGAVWGGVELTPPGDSVCYASRLPRHSRSLSLAQARHQPDPALGPGVLRTFLPQTAADKAQTQDPPQRESTSVQQRVIVFPFPLSLFNQARFLLFVLSYYLPIRSFFLTRPVPRPPA